MNKVWNNKPGDFIIENYFKKQHIFFVYFEHLYQ